MLLHHPDPNDVEAYKAMEQFVEEEKIRSIGLSNWYVEELTEFLPQVDTVPALVQNEIHPYYQENDVIPFIQDLGIVVQGWYPLGGRGHTGELLGDSVISEIAGAHAVPVDGVTVEDLDKESFDIFRREALRSGRMTEEDLNMSNEQLLDSLGLFEQGRLKRAAILLFHRNPEKWVTGAYIKIGYFGEGSDLRYQDEIHGSLFI